MKQVTKTLRPNQVSDLAFYLRNPKCANLADPAVGKTGSVDVYMYYLWTKFRMRSIFLMPTHLFDQNVESLLEFTPFEPQDIIVLDGNYETTLRQIRENPQAKVFLGSFAFFNSFKKMGEVYDKQTQTMKPGLVPMGISKFDLLKQAFPGQWANFIDEWHLGFKGWKSSRTQKWVWHCHNDFPVMVAMTGTPITGRLDTAYPLIHVIEPRYYYNYEQFMAIHAVYNNFTGKQEGWQGTDRITQILKRHTIRRTFEEEYGPEAKEIIVQRIKALDDQMELYAKVKDKAELYVKGELKDASGGVAFMRSRQIFQVPQELGYLKMGKLPKDEMALIHIAAAKQAGKSIAIFGSFQAEVERLSKIANDNGYTADYLHGSAGKKNRKKRDAAFRSRELDVIFATPKTAGTGLNWGHVDIIVFLSLDPEDDAFLQAYRRAIRGVRKSPLLIYILSYDNSIDQHLFAIVDRKMRLAKEVDPTKEVFGFENRSEDRVQPMTQQVANQNRIPPKPVYQPGKKITFNRR